MPAGASLEGLGKWIATGRGVVGSKIEASEGGEGCGVRIRAANAFLGWGDRIIGGSDATVNVSLESREWRESVGRRFGRLVAFAKSAALGAPRDSDLRGTCGGFSFGGVSGDI